MEITYNSKKILIHNIKILSSFERGIGLMFSSRKKAKALLFNCQGTIHSFFVFFPFIALWLDSENNAVDMQIVNPFKLHVSSRKPYKKLLEIPLNDNYRGITSILVGSKKV